MAVFVGFPLTLGLMAYEETPEKLVRKAVVSKVHDGDTLTVKVSYSFNVRLLDCWAPEVTGLQKQEGIKSRDHLNSLVKVGDEVLLEIPITGNLEDSISLGRVLGRVYKDLNADGTPDDLSEQMVKDGFASKTKAKTKP